MRRRYINSVYHKPSTEMKGFCTCKSDLYLCQICKLEMCSKEQPPKWDEKITGNRLAGNVCPVCYQEAKSKNAASEPKPKKVKPVGRRYYLGKTPFKAKWTIWKIKAAGELGWSNPTEPVLKTDGIKLTFHWAYKYETGLEKVSGVMVEIDSIFTRDSNPNGASSTEKWFVSFENCLNKMTPELIQQHANFMAYLKANKLYDVLDSEIKIGGTNNANQHWRNRFVRK